MRRREIQRGGYIVQSRSSLAHILPPGQTSVIAACGKHRFTRPLVTQSRPVKICGRCLAAVEKTARPRLAGVPAIRESQGRLF